MRIAVWLARHLTEALADPILWLDYHTTARNFREGVLLLQRGEAEVAILNPRGLGALAIRGRGLFSEAFSSLRALATFPHDDWCLFAVDRALGVRSFADLKAGRVPLKLATGFLDGDNAVSWTALELLRRHGIEPEELEARGGRIIGTGIGATRDLVAAGEANAICQEAAFLESTRELVRTRSLVCLPTEPEVAEGFRRDFGFEMYQVPANYYAGQPEPFQAPDFSGWPLCVRDDMDEELAYTIARLVLDNGSELESAAWGASMQLGFGANALPPVVPTEVAETSPVPLHPGAERLYRERGLLHT